MRSAGTRPRYATCPEKRGDSGPTTTSRTVEWMPSAPTTTSASAVTPFLESHLHTVRVLGHSDASMVKIKDAIWHRRGKNVEQIGAMEIIIGSAEVTLAGVGEGLASDLTPVIPTVDDDRARPHSEAAQRLL